MSKHRLHLAYEPNGNEGSDRVVASISSKGKQALSKMFRDRTETDEGARTLLDVPLDISKESNDALRALATICGEDTFTPLFGAIEEIAQHAYVEGLRQGARGRFPADILTTPSRKGVKRP